jgi:hypothetical protein
MRALLFVAIAAAAAVLGTAILNAHSWYPERCCGHHDCFPADDVRRLSDGTLELRHGTIVVRVTRTFPIETSPDARPHFCVWHSGWSYEARCIFLPAGW